MIQSSWVSKYYTTLLDEQTRHLLEGLIYRENEAENVLIEREQGNQKSVSHQDMDTCEHDDELAENDFFGQKCCVNGAQVRKLI